MAIEGDDFASIDFRRGIWRQTATTVAMVTSAGEAGENVMACEWAMMISGAPLRFVISIAPHHVSHELIEASGEFGLNFCSDRQAKQSHVSGSNSMRNVDKWPMADFVRVPGKTIGAPMLDGCALNVECRVVGTQPFGDHTVFIGEATWARFDAELEPLIYHGGKYWHLGEQVAKE